MNASLTSDIAALAGDFDVTTITLTGPLAQSCDHCGDLGSATCTVTYEVWENRCESDTTTLTVHPGCVLDAALAAAEQTAGNDAVGHSCTVTVELGEIAYEVAA